MQSRLQVGSALALGVGLLLVVILLTGLLNSFQARFSDFLYQPSPPIGQVVLIVVDDASLAEIGPWPWPRVTFAELIDAMASAPPRVIAFDIIFPDPSPDDAALVQAIRRVPEFVQPVVGVGATRFPANVNAFPRFDTALATTPALQTSNTTLAHTLIMPDTDGIVRSIPIAIDASGRRYAALGLAALGLYQRQALALQLENGSVAFDGMRLPVDTQGQMHLNFVSPNTRRVVSFVDALRGRVDLARLRDKIVLIGVTSSAAPESFETPLSLGSRRVYPVEIQADLIETLLGHHVLAEQDRLTQIVLIFLMALLAGATLPHFRLLSAAALTIVYFLAYLVYAFQKFNDGIIVQPLYPALALLFTFACTMTFRHFAEERPRASIGRLFRQYVAPEAVDQVLQVFDHGALALGGVRREVSILCVDLREFATLAKTLTPEALVDLLNQYVALVTAIIFRHAGSVVRHMGNTILAVWSLPLDQTDHARRAVRAAVEIKQEIAQLRKKQPQDLTIDVGMGITTGSVVAGRIGTSAFAEYSIIGEVVTIAERLALRRDGALFLDAATHEQIADEFETREVKPLRLRRKSDPLNVWEMCEPMELEPINETHPHAEWTNEN
jgi:adenylate cyclase